MILIVYVFFSSNFDKTICFETDSKLVDGVIYLPNKIKPFSGNNLCKYDNNQPKSKGKIKGGKKNKLWIKWNENGQKLFEKNYINGTLSTETRYLFDESGQLEEELYFKDDDFLARKTLDSYYKNDMIEFGYFNNGKRKYESNFQFGLTHGKSTEWFQNGEVKSEENYKEGVKHGKSTEWFQNGEIKSKKIYKNGVCEIGDC